MRAQYCQRGACLVPLKATGPEGAPWTTGKGETEVYWPHPNYVYPTILFKETPLKPGIYAFFQNYPGAATPCAYVGSSGKIRTRITHHLNLQIGTVSSKGRAVSLNIDQLTDCHYWVHEKFTDKSYLHAAEILFMDYLKPVYRNESNITRNARDILDEDHLDYDAEFIQQIEKLSQEPTGRVSLPSMTPMHNRISDIEERLEIMEKRFDTLDNPK